MPRPISKPVGQQVQVPGTREQTLIYGSDTGVTGGINTFQDSVVIPPSQFTNEVNVTNRESKLSRRAGSNAITPTPPDSEKVLSFYTTSLWNTDDIQLRFVKDNVYARSSGTWNPFTGTAFTGSDNDRFRTIIAVDRVFTTNNGVDPIRELDVNSNAILGLGNAPRFKYICFVADRIVGGYLLNDEDGDNPLLIGWSGDINFTEWDPTVDFSAGSNPLYESQSNYSDFVTGVFGFEIALLAMRQRSIVLGTLQPSATDPFYFYTAVPGIGSDTPDSIQQIPGGVIFYDRRTEMVYQFMINSTLPEKIGLPIAKTLTAQITDKDLLFSSFDPINLEYQLCIPVASSTIVRIWTFNLLTNAWSYDERPNVSSIDNVDFSVATGTIGDLLGTIGDLVGDIAGLSPSVNTSSRFYSQTDGNILQYDPTLDHDNGLAYNTTIESKVFETNVIDSYYQRIRFEIIVRLDTSLDLYYSKDNGETYTFLKTVSLSAGANRQLVIANKHIRSRQLKWKLVSSSGLWDIVAYEVHAIDGSASRASDSKS